MNLTDHQLDAWKAVLNIGLDRATSVLNEMLGVQIHLRIPSSKVQRIAAIAAESPAEMLAGVHLGFAGDFAGTAALVFPTDSATTLLAILLGNNTREADADGDSLRIGTLTEIGNIVINAVMSAIGTLLKQRMEYTVPTYLEDTLASLIAMNPLAQDAKVQVTQVRFSVEQMAVNGDLMLFFDVGSCDTLLDAIQKLQSS